MKDLNLVGDHPYRCFGSCVENAREKQSAAEAQEVACMSEGTKRT